MGQLHQELWTAEYPIDQAVLTTGAAALAIAAAKIPGPWGKVVQAGSMALAAAALRQQKEHTGKYDVKEVAALLAGAAPGAMKAGEAIGDALGVEEGGETVKTAQEALHAAAATVAAYGKIEDAHAQGQQEQGKPQCQSDSNNTQQSQQKDDQSVPIFRVCTGPCEWH